MIPKIIHYCWLSDDPVPAKFQSYMNGWKEKLVGYEFVKWDFHRFEKSSSAWVSEAFDCRQYAFAADYIRLYAVYHHGGIYMDMDVEVLKPFDDLLDKPTMFAREEEGDALRIEAGCFGAEKGNEFLGLCLDRYQDRHFILPDGSYDRQPIPEIMQEILEENHISLPTYPWTYFTAKSYHTGLETPTEETYAIHHFEGSWKSAAEKEEAEIRRRCHLKYGERLGRIAADYIMAYKDQKLRGTAALTAEKLKKKWEILRHR